MLDKITKIIIYECMSFTKEIDYMLAVSKLQWIETHPLSPDTPEGQKQLKQKQKLINECMEYSSEQDNLTDYLVPEMGNVNYDMRLMDAELMTQDDEPEDSVANVVRVW